MHKVLAAAACLLVLPLPVLAQSSSRDDDRDRSYDRSDSRKDDRYRPNEDWDRSYHGRYGDDFPRRGSSFHIRIGDAKIQVRCGPRETLKDCVDAATTLLDKARSLPVTGGASTGSGNTPSKP